MTFIMSPPIKTKKKKKILEEESKFKEQVDYQPAKATISNISGINMRLDNFGLL